MHQIISIKYTRGMLFLSTIAIALLLGVYASYRYKKPCSAKLHRLIERDNPFCKIHHAQTIIQNADIQAGMNVLDAGCGPGRLTLPAAKKVGSQGSIVALDMQDEMLNYVKEKASKDSLNNIEFICEGLGKNTLKTSQFDRALLVTVLGEIPDQAAALNEIFSSLKPSGILSITETVFDPDYCRQSTVRTLAQKAGFKEKALYGNWWAYTLNFEKP